MCSVAVAAAPQSSPSTQMLRKYRDSKISRIQPYIPPASVIDSRNHMQNENDATIKYFHANKFSEKYHAHKKFGLEAKKERLNNHELLK